MGCLVDTPTELVAFLVSGDWIVSNSSEPGKVYIMMLGPTESSSDYISDIEIILRMIINQN